MSIEEFRPISPISSIYKVIAKVLANRMGKVVGKVISANQTAFLGGSNILDGAVVANEIVDEVKKSKRKLFLFKIDFEKAYDSVDWDFLVGLLRVLGFGDKWCRWIKECVSTADASILINGSPTPPFKLGRGLRQGIRFPRFFISLWRRL